MNNVWIVAIVAFITASAALLPKILGHLRGRDFGDVSGSYECGFQNKSQGFVYATENYKVVALFVVTEVVVAALLLSCLLVVSNGLAELRTFAKYLLAIILLAVATSYRLCFRKESMR
jgi:NADH:ubiquinone oxidoreductase subunit 3 (subunit A)